MRRLLLPLVLLSVNLGAHAATPTASDLIDELSDLTDRARVEQAANPWLEKELRALVRKHDKRWPEVLIRENFQDGEMTNNPTWSVSQGAFHVDNKMLVGTVAKGDDFNRAVIKAHITNAFSVSTLFALTPDNRPGRLVIGVIQDNPERYGYRLRILGGEESTVELLRTSRHGKATVAKVTLAKRIDDGVPHLWRWQHAKNDTVVVKLDGEHLFEVTDSSFKDPYEKLVVRQGGGELRMNNIQVRGTR
jgi:hypothetical protein